MKPIRMCYVGMFDLPSDCENWIANALSRAGVLVYRWQRKIMDMFTLNSYLDFKAFLSFIKQYNINVVLFNKAPEIQLEWINELNNNDVRVVWWTFDSMNQPGIRDWFISLAKMSDICFMTDGIDEDNFYAQNRINRVELHQGFAPMIHRPIVRADSPYINDIVFLGSSYTSQRRELIEFLTSTYGDRFKHYGNHNALHSGLWGEEFCHCVTSSKIIVGDNFVNTIPGYWSDRVYLTLACRGFFITHYVKGLENEFENHKDLVWWNNFRDLQSSIDYYLNPKNEFERNIITLNGMRLVTVRDSYDNRIQIFLKHLKELL